MNSLISADFYRVRRGAAMRNAIIVMAVVVLFMMFVLRISQTNIQYMFSRENMTAEEVAEMEQDFAAMQEETIEAVSSGADFQQGINSMFMLPLFILCISLVVFCADFSAKTYRNTLSYESNRSRIYMAKLLLSVLLCVGLVGLILLFSGISGGLVFGFSGFSFGHFAKLLKTVLLQMPMAIAIAAFCHCIISFTHKSAHTIGIVLAVMFLLNVGGDILSANAPDIAWLRMLNPFEAGAEMAGYADMPPRIIIAAVASSAVIAAVTTLLGMNRFRKIDLV